MDPSDWGGENLVRWGTAGGIGLAWDLNQLCKFFSRVNAGVANGHAENDILDRCSVSGLPLLEPRFSLENRLFKPQ